MDYTVGDTIYFKFTTRAFATGIPTVLAGTPVLSAYEDASTTQITAGVSVTADLDSVAGLNLATIVATGGNGFESGKHYGIVITTGTVGGVSVVGEVIGQFTLEKSAAAVDLANGTDGLGAIKAETALIVADTNELQTDDVPGLIAALNDPTSAAIADAVWDEILTGATHNIATSAGRRLRGLQDFGAYSGGFIYIDTVNGTAGTTDFENGVDSNPVDSIADANTIAASLGISQFKIAPGSTITLAATQSNQVFSGEEWTLALGGQNIAGSYFEGASVSGTGTGADPHFMRCEIGTVTFAANRMGFCRFTGTITLSGAADYYWHDCYSGVAGSGTPVVDFGALVGNTNISMRRYSGGVQIDNKDATGTDLMSLEGDGQLVVSAGSSGAISVRGNFKVTNTGGATITYDDNTQNLVDALADTNELQGDWVDGGRLDLILDAVLADTNELQSDDVPGLIAALNDLSAANVNAEVLDVMNVDTITLPGQTAPPLAPTHRQAIAWLYKALRNRKTQTATQWSLLADNETTVDAKATVSDDGSTATKTEIVSGP